MQNNPGVRLRNPRNASQAEKAIVRFGSQVEAHRAVRERQHGFCGNSQVRLRVLQ